MATKEMSNIDIQLQAQEHIYRQTLQREKSKAGKNALDEIGRSLNAIAQRRRQYFLPYKNCNSIKSVRQWFAWESKRNLETNFSEERRDNAAIRGVKMFLHRIDFYKTLLARFVEYILSPLHNHYITSNKTNSDLEKVKSQMEHLKKNGELLLSDNNEVTLESANYSDVEKHFPVISILPRIHDILYKMVSSSFLWRMHARYEQMFEDIESRRKFTETDKDLEEQRKMLRNMERQIRKTRRSNELLEKEISERRQAISVSSFADEYTRCTDEIERVNQALEQCQANIDSTNSTIKTVQLSFGKYKTVGAKKKQKLESSILKRSRKVEELVKIKQEMERLENHKLKLDEEEMAWLRGGYESAMEVIETLKEQSQILQNNLVLLEEQRDQIKKNYEHAIDEVLHVSTEHDQLTHKYEYVKRLAAIILREALSKHDQRVVVRPNKISVDAINTDDVYDMIQPKGVAMVIHNEWNKKSTKSKATQERSSVDRRRDLGSSLDSLCIQFGYYVIHRSNLSAAEMKHHMIGLSDQYHGYQGDHNSLLVVMVAQSNEKGQIIDNGGKTLKIAELIQHFISSRCPALIGKPKVFLFLLKVTARDPTILLTKKMDDLDDNRITQSEVGIPEYFEPEPVSVEDDFLVARVMYEDDETLEDTPTFGGITHGNDSDIPWFAETFVRLFSEQAGSKDILAILQNVKRSFQEQLASTARSTDAMTSSRNKSTMSQMTIRSRKLSDVSGHVNIFLDHSLKKKLYIMPGI